MNKMVQKELKGKDILYPELSYKIVGCAFDVFNGLGAGYNEKYYQKAPAESSSKKELKLLQQVNFLLKYQDKIIGRNFFDFLVKNKIA